MNIKAKAVENEMRIESEIAIFAIREFVKKLFEYAHTDICIVETQPDGTQKARRPVITAADLLEYAESLLKQNSEGKES